MGGMISLYVANRRARELGGVVPVCTAGLHHPAWISAIASPAARKLLPAIAIRPMRPFGRAGAARWLVASRTPEVMAHLPRYLGHLRPARVAHQLSIVRRLLDEQQYPLEMSSIECPVMFVWGDRDVAVVWSRNGPRLLKLAEAAPSARNEVIAGCGHAPQIEAPDALMALIDSLGDGTRARRHLRPLEAS
jgi:pimeloyl-ACP methyl ester carboxylesterase